MALCFNTSDNTTPFMFFSSLFSGTLIKRYKRFLADIVLCDSKELTIYCPNTGPLRDSCLPGDTVWVSTTKAPRRKYPHTLEIVRGVDGAYVGVNTQNAQKVIKTAWQSYVTDPSCNPALDALFSGYVDQCMEEVTVGSCRFDYRFSGSAGTRYVEVKNVHWKRIIKEQPCACFPDTISMRATKHVKALQEIAQKESVSCVLVHVVQRNDVDFFAVAADIDPAYNAAVHEALQMQFLAYSCHISPEGITLNKTLPFLRLS